MADELTHHRGACEPSWPRQLVHGTADWIRRSVDSYQPLAPVPDDRLDRVDWVRCLPFIALHLACLAVIWVGWSWVAVGTAIALYVVRMFAITAFYHRYFSHRSFKTSRGVQFLFAVIGNSSGQRGPLWWAAHHRHHHRASDREDDIHSPHQRGFLWSHMFWFMSRRHYHTELDEVGDLAKYPELRFIDRFDVIVPFALGLVLFGIGEMLGYVAPQLGTNGLQMVVWGAVISTVVLFHATVTINSLSHLWGTRRFQTSDHSRNNFLLAILTMGEGWHNNHHYYPGSIRQGFYWWEIDLSYYILRVMAWLGIVWDLNPVPQRVYESTRRVDRGATR